MFLSSRKKNTDNKLSEYDIADINSNYVATPYQSPEPEERQREIDIKKIFDELYKTNSSNT
jgi:hypothetical protein